MYVYFVYGYIYVCIHVYICTLIVLFWLNRIKKQRNVYKNFGMAQRSNVCKLYLTLSPHNIKIFINSLRVLICFRTKIRKS